MAPDKDKQSLDVVMVLLESGKAEFVKINKELEKAVDKEELGLHLEPIRSRLTHLEGCYDKLKQEYIPKSYVRIMIILTSALVASVTLNGVLLRIAFGS